MKVSTGCAYISTNMAWSWKLLCVRITAAAAKFSRVLTEADSWPSEKHLEMKKGLFRSSDKSVCRTVSFWTPEQIPKQVGGKWRRFSLNEIGLCVSLSEEMSAYFESGNSHWTLPSDSGWAFFKAAGRFYKPLCWGLRFIGLHVPKHCALVWRLISSLSFFGLCREKTRHGRRHIVSGIWSKSRIPPYFFSVKLCA